MIRCFNKVIDEEIISHNTVYLCEKWSRSDEIDNVVKSVFDQIENTIGTATVHQVTPFVSLYAGSCQCQMWEEKIRIEYYVYNTDSVETAKEVIRTAHNMNGYDEQTKELILTLYLVNGDVLEPMSTKNISHEVEHILQIQYAKKNNKNYKRLNTIEYEYASEVIGSEKTSLSEKKLAWLFYYSNRHEQDAFINEYYEDLKDNRQFIIDRDSETHSRLFSYEHLAKWVQIVDDVELENLLKPYRKFGYDKKAFNIMIEKGLQRFKKKMNNVEKHFQDRIATLNETHAHYIHKNIGSIRKIKINE